MRFVRALQCLGDIVALHPALLRGSYLPPQRVFGRIASVPGVATRRWSATLIELRSYSFSSHRDGRRCIASILQSAHGRIASLPLFVSFHSSDELVTASAGIRSMLSQIELMEAKNAPGVANFAFLAGMVTVG